MGWLDGRHDGCDVGRLLGLDDGSNDGCFVGWVDG